VKYSHHSQQQIVNHGGSGHLSAISGKILSLPEVNQSPAGCEQFHVQDPLVEHDIEDYHLSLHQEDVCQVPRRSPLGSGDKHDCQVSPCPHAYLQQFERDCQTGGEEDDSDSHQCWLSVKCGNSLQIKTSQEQSALPEVTSSIRKSPTIA
jgi:hypothetical protein